LSTVLMYRNKPVAANQALAGELWAD